MERTRYPVFLALLIHCSLPAQYFFDFETDGSHGGGSCPDQPWVAMPEGRWECDTEGAITGIRSLHHTYDNTVAGCDWIVLEHDPAEEGSPLELSFRIRHGYAPSSLNNWQVALLADLDTTGGIGLTEGVVLGVNFTGSDDLLKLWLCSSGEVRELAATPLNYQEDVGTDAAPEFRLLLQPDGSMGLYYRMDPETDPFEKIATSQRDPLPKGRQLVIRYEYSPARDRNLWLDDLRLEGTFIRDTLAPEVLDVEVLDSHRLQVYFSEPVIRFSENSFMLKGAEGPWIPPVNIRMEAVSALLEFPQPLSNRVELVLRAANLCDGEGNCLQDTLLAIFRNDAEWGDVVFSELMADPLPAVLLPEEEYIELYNRSGYGMELTGWSVEVDGREYPLTGDLLPADSFLLIRGITLPNEGARLALYNGQGTLIHAARYAPPWKGPGWKSEGGWSLESPDPALLCNTSMLWEYSSAPAGGTPGAVNSCHTSLSDTEPPRFLFHGYPDPTGSILLQYSEPVRFRGPGPEAARIQPGGLVPDSAAPVLPLYDQWMLWFPGSLAGSPSFTLQAPAAADCEGNPGEDLEIRTGRPADPGPGALLINEIMYDPVEGAPEYIELYVPGPGYLDLRQFALDVVSAGTVPDSPLPLSEPSRIVAPGEFLVVTRCVPCLMDSYGLELSGKWVEATALDPLPNSGGTVLLTDRSGGPVDRAPFGDPMHVEFLGVTSGVSLERISTERSGLETSNWHSAASLEGYATPGRINSQWQGIPEPESWMEVDPGVFSPDNDGMEDLLRISLAPAVHGWVLTLWITDLGGRPVRILASDHLVGPATLYTWDGEGEGGRMVAEGIYILHLRAYHPDSGEMLRRRKAVGVVYR